MSDLKDKLPKPGAAVEQQGNAPAQSTVGALLAGIGPQLEAALGASVDKARFGRVVLTEVRKNPQLLQCTPASLLGAVLTAAQLRLEPGPLQHSYLIPRQIKGIWQVQFEIGYRGMIDLALRGGRTCSIDAHVVREGDEFDFEYGTKKFLRHKPVLRPLLRDGEDDTAGSAIAVYANAELATGGAPFVVLDPRDVARRRAHAAPNSPAWKNQRDAMWQKSAVRALQPFLPQTPDLANALRLDETIRTDIDAGLDDLEPEYVDNEAGEGEPPVPPERESITTAGPPRASVDDIKRIEAQRGELDDQQRHRLDEWWKVRGYGSLNERAKKRLLAQDVEPILEEIAQYVAERDEQERAAREAGES